MFKVIGSWAGLRGTTRRTLSRGRRKGFIVGATGHCFHTGNLRDRRSI